MSYIDFHYNLIHFVHVSSVEVYYRYSNFNIIFSYMDACKYMAYVVFSVPDESNTGEVDVIPRQCQLATDIQQLTQVTHRQCWHTFEMISLKHIRQLIKLSTNISVPNIITTHTLTRPLVASGCMESSVNE